MARPVIPRKDNSAKPRPRLSVVRSELRLRESRLGREPRGRLLAHPLEYDNRAIPVAQPRLTGGQRTSAPALEVDPWWCWRRKDGGGAVDPVKKLLDKPRHEDVTDARWAAHKRQLPAARSGAHVSAN